jgi:hypothetical protein
MLSVSRSIIITSRNRTSRLREGILHLSMGKLHPLSKTLYAKTKSNPTYPHPHRSKSLQSNSLSIQTNPSATFVANPSQPKKYYLSIFVYIRTPVLTPVPYAISDSPRHPPYWSIQESIPAKSHLNVKSVGNDSEKVVI